VRVLALAVFGLFAVETAFGLATCIRPKRFGLLPGRDGNPVWHGLGWVRPDPNSTWPQLGLARLRSGCGTSAAD
jgi:hypothetical protein